MNKQNKKMSPSHAAGLHDEKRRRQLPPEKLIALIRPFAGMALADIGVGTGFCSIPLLESVNWQATYYAVDAQAEMLEKFRERLAGHEHADAVRMILTPDDRVDLPDQTVDVAVACSVYHELPDRARHAVELRRILKPGGRLVVVDWKSLATGEERTVGPPAHHRVDVKEAIAELTAAGFTGIVEHHVFDQLWALTTEK